MATDGFVSVGKSSDFPPGLVKVVKVADVDVMAANIGGTIYAILNKCTHVGGPLGKGTLAGSVIQCPWHGSKFDVKTGAVVLGPATKPEPVVPVKVEGGTVWMKKPT